MSNKNKCPIINEEDLVISEFQPADYLESDDMAREYLDNALSNGNSEQIFYAIGQVEKNFYDMAEQALSHYKETGLHLTHEEVADWLTSYKTGNIPKVMPECHKV